jgi:IS5 family transposase
MQDKEKPIRVYAYKAYCRQDNCEFLHMNEKADGIMRKDCPNVKLTGIEHERNKGISEVCYKIEQYFGITERHMAGGRARFPTLIKEHCFLPVAKRKGIGFDR